MNESKIILPWNSSMVWIIFISLILPEHCGKINWTGLKFPYQFPTENFSNITVSSLNHFIKSDILTEIFCNFRKIIKKSYQDT